MNLLYHTLLNSSSNKKIRPAGFPRQPRCIHLFPPYFCPGDVIAILTIGTQKFPFLSLILWRTSPTDKPSFVIIAIASETIFRSILSLAARASSPRLSFRPVFPATITDDGDSTFPRGPFSVSLDMTLLPRIKVIAFGY